MKRTRVRKTKTEMKNTLGGINRLVDAEEWMSNLKDWVVESNHAEQQKRKMIRNETRLRGLCNMITCNNISIKEIPEGEESEEGAEKLFKERITKTSLTKEGKKGIRVQESKRAPSKKTPRRSTPRYIRTTVEKTKGKKGILKAAREKQTIEGHPPPP